MIEIKQYKFLPILLFLVLVNCKKTDKEYLENFKNYEITLSNNDYEINLKTGKIESDYFKIYDSINFSKNEELEFAKLFFDNNLKKLNGDIVVNNDDGISIQPDIGTAIFIKYLGKNKATISISGYADSVKVRKNYIPYLRFESKAHKLLEKNKKFQIIKKKIDLKEDDRIYL
ncbi:hypothetical protein [Chryseobacterium binzhouense]|uniref:hypothetical protein n=1 Tax=Chryseobacterium binzhouense TaxID=2593646 RepID=UPI00289F91CB|nr:hypothetical protein [Chryseobacterium binzhouense]